MSDYISSYTGEEIDEAVGKILNGFISSGTLLTSQIATGSFSLTRSGFPLSNSIDIGFIPAVIKVWWAPGTNTTNTNASDSTIGSLASLLCYSGSGGGFTELSGFANVVGNLDASSHTKWTPMGYQGDYVYEAYGSGEPTEGEITDFESWKKQQMLDFENWKKQQMSAVTGEITEFETWLSEQEKTCEEWQNKQKSAFETWFNDLTESLTVNVNPASSHTYEAETDENGHADLPFTYNDNQTVLVYINGIFATADKDYTIDNGSIQLVSNEFASGNDVITFVVFKAGVVTGGTGGTSDDEEITISDIDQVLSEVEGFND